MISTKLKAQADKIFTGFELAVNDIYSVVGDLKPCITYLRKSVQRDDKDAESIASQLYYCCQRAKILGWIIVGIYVDEGISAHSGDERPDFNRMRADMLNKPEAKRLIVREQSRLTRAKKLSFSIALFEDFTDNGIEAYSSDGESIKEGLLSTFKSMSDKEYSESVSRASKQKAELRAYAGRFPKTAVPPYGYTTGYEKIIESQAKLLREAKDRYLAGESLYDIVKDWRSKGITFTQDDIRVKVRVDGKEVLTNGQPTYTTISRTTVWQSGRLSELLQRPENAGLRSYQPKDSPMQITAKDACPKLWSEAEYERLVAKAKQNKPFARNSARKYLLTGILVCHAETDGVICGQPLAARAHKRYPSYYCPSGRGGCGKINRSMSALENYILKLTYDAIQLLPKVTEEPQEDTIGPQIEELESEIAELDRAYKAREIKLNKYLEFTQDFEGQIKALRATQKTSAPLPVSDAQSFKSATVEKQRATIKRMWGRIGVLPAGKKGVRFDPSQLVIDK